MLFARNTAAIALALLLPACGMLRDQADPGVVSIRGVPPTLEQLNTTARSSVRDSFVADLVHEAGLDQPPRPRDENWSLVMVAGVYEVDRQCDQYLDALFRFNREQRAGREGLAAAAAATGAIMGLAGVGAKAIAITAAAFGLSASIFDASVNSVLFTIEPSALRNVVLQGRQNYLDGLAKRKVATRPDMMIAVQGYLTQCTPAAIEANINNAANGSLNAVTYPHKEVAEAAAVLAAPGLMLLAPTISAIQPGTQVTRIQPQQRFTGAVVATTVQQRKVKLARAIRAEADPQVLQQAAAALGLDVAGLPMPQQRATVLVEVNRLVSSENPAVARQQMDGVSRLLAPILKQPF